MIDLEAIKIFNEFEYNREESETVKLFYRMYDELDSSPIHIMMTANLMLETFKKEGCDSSILERISQKVIEIVALESELHPGEHEKNLDEITLTMHKVLVKKGREILAHKAKVGAILREEFGR